MFTWYDIPFFVRCPCTGIGFAMCIISGVVSIYYNVIITYALYYMFVAFVNLDDELPWARCRAPWATSKCRDVPYPVFSSLNDTAAMKAIKGKNCFCVRQVRLQ